MKTICLVVPTFNEVQNVNALYAAITNVFKAELSEFEYSILFIDNCSQDGTKEKLRALTIDKRVRCIFNTKNFGPRRSGYNGMINSHGDAMILICADFQDPPELIPQLIRSWMDGHKVVMAKKISADENKFIYFIRSIYYHLLTRANPMYAKIHGCTGFGIYDRVIVDRFRSVRDREPFFRGIVAEVSGDIHHMPYHRPNRSMGKRNNIANYWDEGLTGLINNSKLFIRMILFTGLITSILSICAAIFYVTMKLTYWSSFPTALAPLFILQFGLFGILLFSIGMVAEYAGAIYSQVLDRDLVYEEERINFD